MRFEVGSFTDTGRVRESNQDRLLVAGDFVAVADGMGGHAGGELAAETAIDDLRRFGEPHDAEDVVTAIRQANRAVVATAERHGLANMGTTVVAALLRPIRRSVTIANVGDSRAYLLHNGELDQVTRDHSLVQDLLRSGRISEDEARDHPHRNVLTRVLGIADEIDVDTFELAVSEGDLILLASDGLFNEVDVDDMARIVGDRVDLGAAAADLVAQANENGGNDNITVILARVVDDAPQASAPAPAREIAGQNGQPVEEPDGGAVTGETIEPGQAEVAPSRTDEDDEPEHSGLDADSDVDATDERQTAEVPVVPAPARRRPSRLRALVFTLCVLALLGLGAGAFIAYGRNAWFVEPVANEVVIHRGRPGGLLFIEPTPVQPTGIDIDDLNPASRNRVEEIPVFSSLEDAQRFVDQLELSAVRAGE